MEKLWYASYMWHGIGFVRTTWGDILVVGAENKESAREKFLEYIKRTCPNDYEYFSKPGKLDISEWDLSSPYL